VKTGFPRVFYTQRLAWQQGGDNSITDDIKPCFMILFASILHNANADMEIEVREFSSFTCDLETLVD
jgi:hypothetical protein